MKTALMIILVIIVIAALVYLALWLLNRKIDAYFARTEKPAREMVQHAAQIQASHKSIDNQLAHIRPKKMYDTLEELIPQLTLAVNGINSMQDKLDNHEKRITDIERIIKRMDAKAAKNE